MKNYYYSNMKFGGSNDKSEDIVKIEFCEKKSILLKGVIVLDFLQYYEVSGSILQLAKNKQSNISKRELSR